MSWLEQAENLHNNRQNLMRTLNNLLNNFYSAKEKVLQFEVPGYTIYPNGYSPTRMNLSDRSMNKANDDSILLEVGVGNYGYRYSLQYYPEEPAFGFGKYKDNPYSPGKGQVAENRIIISHEGERKIPNSLIQHNGLYSINFVKMVHQTHIDDSAVATYFYFYQKIIVTPNELKNIPEEVWIDLLGWVLEQVKEIPYDKLKIYIHSDLVDFVDKGEKEYEMAQGKNKTGGCYIATTCYGSYDSKEVRVFRKYRDEILLKSTGGRWFVDIYYKFSPYFAEKLKNMPILNSYIKAILDKIYKILINK